MTTPDEIDSSTAKLEALKSKIVSLNVSADVEKEIQDVENSLQALKERARSLQEEARTLMCLTQRMNILINALPPSYNRFRSLKLYESKIPFDHEVTLRRSGEGFLVEFWKGMASSEGKEKMGYITSAYGCSHPCGKKGGKKNEEKEKKSETGKTGKNERVASRR